MDISMSLINFVSFLRADEKGEPIYVILRFKTYSVNPTCTILIWKSKAAM